MMNQPCLLGINPATKECVMTAVNSSENAEEMRKEGLICVPVSRARARAAFCEVVDDVYEVAK